MIKKNDDTPKVQRKKGSINLISWDELSQNIAYPEIIHTQYSNSLQVQASNDDVYIDFQQLPGNIKDEKLFVNVTRIYLTIEKARGLADGLNSILKKIDVRKK